LFSISPIDQNETKEKHKNSFICLSTNRKSNATGEHTEENHKAVCEGTHISIGVNAARDDVNILIKRIWRWHFIHFVIRLVSWDYDDCFELEKHRGLL